MPTTPPDDTSPENPAALNESALTQILAGAGGSPAPNAESSPGDDGSATGRSRQALALGLAAALIVAAILGLGLSGMRAFVMKTPSMGTAAPVGSLVLTAPAELSTLKVGDIVTVQQNSGASHTHRVVSAEAGRVLTQGDINGAIDPWPVQPQTLIGRSLLIIPAAGWLLRMLPVVMIGALLVWLLTRGVAAGPDRHRFRVMGLFCALAVAIALIRPLLGAELLWLRVDGVGANSTATARVVNTGLLPIKVVPVGGQGSASPRLTSTGSVGEAVTTQADKTGQLGVRPRPALGPVWWFALILFCLSPLLWLGVHNAALGRRGIPARRAAA